MRRKQTQPRKARLSIVRETTVVGRALLPVAWAVTGKSAHLTNLTLIPRTVFRAPVPPDTSEEEHETHGNQDTPP